MPPKVVKIFIFANICWTKTLFRGFSGGGGGVIKRMLRGGGGLKKVLGGGVFIVRPPT